MKTYLLRGDPQKLNEFAAGSEFFHRAGNRALSVRLTPLAHSKNRNGVVVHRTVDGDRSRDLLPWVTKTLIADLNDQFLETRPNKRQREKALNNWLLAKGRVEELQAQLETQEAKLRDCSMTLVSTIGQGPVVIDEVTYDPVPIREEYVIYRPRNPKR